MSEKDPLIFGDDVDAPDDLPEITGKVGNQTARQAARVCEKCQSTSVRINSSAQDFRAWCDKCGHNWAISRARSSLVSDTTFARGLSRQTVEEPDWNLAFEDMDDWDDEKDPNG